MTRRMMGVVVIPIFHRCRLYLLTNTKSSDIKIMDVEFMGLVLSSLVVGCFEFRLRWADSVLLGL